ncbi:toll/interleukin-1 receptor domain-containing protein [Halanaerobium sp. ST460_2HS_T2]|jgi:hypothetical protein|uniref:toll/interleukin-1 receptor domain-containing protein n=1 Tax=Halanaerobium sp. ST460_2HS_T2 TaxID=2183914 RepID=UPI000DF2FC8F|nr:toll/interleukin-1 receptor domain-containing protein [Halanaerobium sp. ST460_2HS_T2]RCW51598.1 TIR domain-containing protein [Halanaerobium sp. ST460_2HS_T2]
MVSLFLSHSSKDKFFVRKLAERLKQNRIEVWIDEAEINIGDSLIKKIGSAIDETDYFGVVLSHNSVNSEWVQKELQLAINRELEEKQVVLPMLLEPVEIPHFLKGKLYADFTTPEKFEKSFPKLLKTLGVELENEEIESQKIISAENEFIEKSNDFISDNEKRLARFEDIKIVDIDDEKSYRPDKNKKLFNIHLKLSNNPPEEWQRIFEAERSFPRHSMWRRAWIEGEYIVIYCPPEEIEEYHLDDLKEDVKNTNIKYREYLTELVQKEVKESKKEKKEFNKITELKRKLKFD